MQTDTAVGKYISTKRASLCRQTQLWVSALHCMATLVIVYLFCRSVSLGVYLLIFIMRCISASLYVGVRGDYSFMFTYYHEAM